jgi:prepilin-type processing-associated H-X9-DG protein
MESGGQWASCLVYLLPQLEQENIYRGLVNPDNPSRSFEFNPSKYTSPWFINTTNYNLATTPLPVFRCPSVPNLIAWSWFGCGAMQTFRGLGYPDSASGFSSRHSSNLVQFCFADGSVRSVLPGNTAYNGQGTPSSDWFLLQQLAGRQDGYCADTSSLLP